MGDRGCDDDVVLYCVVHLMKVYRLFLVPACDTQCLNNYTKLGYAKIKAPGHVFKLIRDFWETNKDKQSPEPWPVG